MLVGRLQFIAALPKEEKSVIAAANSRQPTQTKDDESEDPTVFLKIKFFVCCHTRWTRLS